jgi:hypothetical protein
MALLGLSALVVSSAHAQRAQVGTAVNAVGTLVVIRADGVEDRLQGKGALRLFEHDELKLGPGVQALLELREGIQVALNERTSVQILSRWEKVKGTTRILRIAEGELWAKTVDGPKQFEVETPVATAAVRETEFNLKVEPDGQSILTVIQGIVEFGTSFGTCPIRTSTVSYGVRGKRCTRPAPTETSAVADWSKKLR